MPWEGARRGPRSPPPPIPPPRPLLRVHPSSLPLPLRGPPVPHRQRERRRERCRATGQGHAGHRQSGKSDVRRGPLARRSARRRRRTEEGAGAFSVVISPILACDSQGIPLGEALAATAAATQAPRKYSGRAIGPEPARGRGGRGAQKSGSAAERATWPGRHARAGRRGGAGAGAEAAQAAASRPGRGAAAWKWPAADYKE